MEECAIRVCGVKPELEEYAVRVRGTKTVAKRMRRMCFETDRGVRTHAARRMVKRRSAYKPRKSKSN